MNQHKIEDGQHEADRFLVVFLHTREFVKAKVSRKRQATEARFLADIYAREGLSQ